jgi:hypothetical protein
MEREMKELYNVRGRYISVFIATHYGLEGPEIESQWGRDFPHLSKTALQPSKPPL